MIRSNDISLFSSTSRKLVLTRKYIILIGALLLLSCEDEKKNNETKFEVVFALTERIIKNYEEAVRYEDSIFRIAGSLLHLNEFENVSLFDIDTTQ